MKKKILFLLLVPVLVICLTACTDSKGKTIVLEDSKYGKTTFNYDSKEVYKDIKVKKGGASKSLTFKNEDLNIKVEMYYNKMSNSSYDTTRDSRKSQVYYADSVFGKYTGYFYSNDKDSGYLNIILDVNDNKEVTVLFVSIEKINNKTDEDMFSMVEKNDIKKFFDSIVFEK